MPRLIWVFAGRTVTLLVLLCRGSFKLRFTVQLEIWVLVKMNSWKIQLLDCLTHINSSSFLAHLRRRLIGELIFKVGFRRLSSSSSVVLLKHLLRNHWPTSWLVDPQWDWGRKFLQLILVTWPRWPQAHKWYKPLKIFFCRTEWPWSLKLGTPVLSKLFNDDIWPFTQRSVTLIPCAFVWSLLGNYLSLWYKCLYMYIV